MEWISTKDRKPAHSGTYILCTNSGTTTGTYNKDFDRFLEDDYPDFTNIDVIYWMPLPEPPQDIIDSWKCSCCSNKGQDMRQGRKRICLDIPEDLYKAMCESADLYNVTKTKWIIRAILERLNQEKKYNQQDSEL